MAKKKWLHKILAILPSISLIVILLISSFEIGAYGDWNFYEKEYEKMYNPMWNLFGDFEYPPGTYYRTDSKMYNPCWYMLDQVIISQSMIPFMIREKLKIIIECRNKPLYTKNGYPNSNISDHFPIVCEFNI